jgi:hypothetical protein
MSANTRDSEPPARNIRFLTSSRRRNQSYVLKSAHSNPSRFVLGNPAPKTPVKKRWMPRKRGPSKCLLRKAIQVIDRIDKEQNQGEKSTYGMSKGDLHPGSFSAKSSNTRLKVFWWAVYAQTTLGARSGLPLFRSVRQRFNRLLEPHMTQAC